MGPGVSGSRPRLIYPLEGRRQRDPEAEGGPGAKLAFHPDPAVVRLHDAPGDGKAETDATSIRVTGLPVGGGNAPDDHR
jgi:hypothetical protein